MIVTTGFLNHWKTLRLVEITKDPSAPLSVLEFWGHCQTSRRWEFPEMTRDQLAAICRWGSRKPACHVALTKSGFVDRCESGFAAHGWAEANAQLIQKWECGAKGGRPAKPKELPPGETDRFPPVNRSETDLTGLDRTGLELTDKVSDKASKPLRGEGAKRSLSPAQQNLAKLCEDVLQTQWVNDAGKWINRIFANPDKTARVFAEVRSAIAEGRIKSTPAQFAEDTWGRFK